MAFDNCRQHLEIFPGIYVMPLKLQFASPIFQERLPDAVSS